MGRKDKLIARLKAKPKDFTFEELEALLKYFGYERTDKGKTSGSRVIFRRKGSKSIALHKPHPGNELLAYQVKQIIDLLKQEGSL